MSLFDDDPQRAPGGAGRLNFSLEPLLGVMPFIVLRGGATDNLVLPVGAGNRADVLGASVTLRHPGIWLIYGHFYFLGAGVGDEDAAGVGELKVNGVIDTRDRAQHELVRGGDTARATVSTMWVYHKDAPGPEIAKLTGYKGSGTGSSVIGAVDTSIIAWTVPGSEPVVPWKG